MLAMIAQCVSAPYAKQQPKLKDFLIDWDVDPQKHEREMMRRAIILGAEARYRERQKRKRELG